MVGGLRTNGLVPSLPSSPPKKTRKKKEDVHLGHRRRRNFRVTALLQVSSRGRALPGRFLLFQMAVTLQCCQLVSVSMRLMSDPYKSLSF